MPRDRSTARAQQRVAATGTSLVRAAAAVFVERGYHATRVSDIAERAGVGQGTFYRHFSDKRQILDAVVGRTVERLLAAFADENAPEHIETLEQYRERAVDIVGRLFDLAAVEHEEIGFLFRQLPSVDDASLSTLDLVRGTISSVIAQYYRIGMDRGFFRTDLDIDSATTAVVGMGLSAFWQILRAPDDVEFRERYSGTFVEFIVRYAAVTPGVTV